MNDLEIRQFMMNCDSRAQSEDTALKYLRDQKKQHQASKNEQLANRYFIYEECLEIQRTYQQAFSTLKQKKYYDAWCQLETCEIKILHLKKHLSQKELSDYKIDFIERLIGQYQSIYPYKLFLSPEIIETEKRCNICGQIVTIRKHCGHFPGDLYNGEMCCRIVEKAEFVGSALVKNPVQKYSVPFLVDPKTKEKVDHYNYHAVEYLAERLEQPYDDWALERTKKKFPHSRFSDLSRNDKCPCGSGVKYKKCCLKKDGVELDHIEFLLEKPVDPKLRHDGIIIG